MTNKSIVYPPGRYDCARCGETVLVMKAANAPPECPRCGGQEYKNLPEPKVIKKKAKPKRKYKSGMYVCGACGEQMIISEETDELPPCALCNASNMKPV